MAQTGFHWPSFWATGPVECTNYCIVLMMPSLLRTMILTRYGCSGSYISDLSITPRERNFDAEVIGNRDSSKLHPGMNPSLAQFWVWCLTPRPYFPPSPGSASRAQVTSTSDVSQTGVWSEMPKFSRWFSIMKWTVSASCASWSDSSRRFMSNLWQSLKRSWCSMNGTMTLVSHARNRD